MSSVPAARSIALMLAMLGGALGPASAQQEGRPVPAAEIREKIVGATFDWRSNTGDRGTLMLKADGRIEFRTRTGPGRTRLDRGTWRLREDRVCTAYPSHGKGPERCFDLKRTGEGDYGYYEDGRLDGRMSRR
jgi:hypothetical protein